MKNIYIILSQSSTGVARILKFVTRDKYNHSSICLKDDFENFYSFGRKYTNFMIPGGFIVENAFEHVFGKFSKIPCLILKKEVTDEQYLKLQEIIHEFSENKANYSYAILSLFLADTAFSVTSENKYFCSQFVAKVLNDINIATPKSPEHMHPIDFTKIDNVTTLYEGDLKEFCQKK